MVNGKEMKNHETPWKTTRNHENTLENHQNQPKVVKYNDIKKHCQQWLSPNKGISSDGYVCPNNIGLKSLKKKTIAIASPAKLQKTAFSHWSRAGLL